MPLHVAVHHVLPPPLLSLASPPLEGALVPHGLRLTISGQTRRLPVRRRQRTHVALR